ncbi:hypothetical protein Taro_036979 [Colocasia esculenta]|uniref:Uncharacterized protein n=1 Tax=Colocasia esculenta TaxID=4460 RepID=A0A843WHW2_COLES|nr:hypothetical protein [Colocasia esculenta]
MCSINAIKIVTTSSSPSGELPPPHLEDQLLVLPLCLLLWLQVRVSLHFLITNPCILVTAIGAASASPPVAAGHSTHSPDAPVVFLYNSYVAESYSQQMTEKYAGEDEQPPLDPEVWVVASSAPKNGHVYGFGHSIETSRVLSGGSSSASQTSAFNAGVGTPEFLAQINMRTSSKLSHKLKIMKMD